MFKIVNGQRVALTPTEIAAWEAEQAAYVPPAEPEPDPEEILRQAMFDEFAERMATNKTAPAAAKEAALKLKDRKSGRQET